MVMFFSVKQAGGRVAGGGIAIGACLIIALIIDSDIPINPDAAYTIITICTVIAFMSLLFRHHQGYHLSPPHNVYHEIDNIHKDRRISRDVGVKLKKIKIESEESHDYPEQINNIITQLKRILPEEGWLTRRMARLREKAYLIQRGHVARLNETKHLIRNLPVESKRKLSQELIAEYNKMVDIDQRIERVDYIVAENEKRIMEITKQAQTYAKRYNYRKLTELLENAQNLQTHNTNAIKHIDSLEKHLSGVINRVTKNIKSL